jgi:hypothetical protein
MTLRARVLGVAAWATLVLGIVMYSAGSHLAARQFMTQANGPASIPAESPYVSQVYDQRLSNDFYTVARAIYVLDLAGEHERSKRLARFFAFCNVQRLLGQDDACTRETVRTAEDAGSGLPSGDLWGSGLPSDAQWKVDDELASRLNQVLSFSLATERQMHDGINSYGFWNYNQYESSGVLSHDNGKNASIVLAARNQGRWEVAGFRARLTLPAEHLIELDCGRDLFPFHWLHPLTPATEVIRVCWRNGGLDLPDMLPAIQKMQYQDPLPVQLEEFEIKKPYVRVTVESDGNVRRFTLHPAPSFTTEFARFSVPLSVSNEVARELKYMSCEKLNSCPSPGESAALGFYDFCSATFLLLPFFVGILMGIGIGGLFVKSLGSAGFIATAVTLCAIGVPVVLFQVAASGPRSEGRSWALFGIMGLGVLTIGALLLWIPGFLVGFGLTKWVREREGQMNVGQAG